MSMPDKWEYPWFAAWDLAFHCVALAHVDPAFAKYQLILLCREWFQHPNGALPAYEWDFGDVNPPVQAWAALEVFAIDGGRDFDFLSRIFDKLLVNFTWWVNREDAERQQPVRGRLPRPGQHRPDRPVAPAGGRHAGAVRRHRLDGLLRAGAWPRMAAVLHRAGQPAGARPGAEVPGALRRHRATRIDSQGLWDETDGLFYDRLLTPDGTAVPVKVRSMVGMIPLLAAVVVDEHDARPGARRSGKQFADFLRRARPATTGRAAEPGVLRGRARRHGGCLLGLVGIGPARDALRQLFDEREFLSPYGLRALSAYHRDHPYVLDVEGIRPRIDYEPAESTTAMFGGNSNWRGPLWFPLNYLVDRALCERYHLFFGDDVHRRVPDRLGPAAVLSTRSPTTCATG